MLIRRRQTRVPGTGTLQAPHLHVLLRHHGADPRCGVRVGNDKDHVSKLFHGLDALLRILDCLLFLQLKDREKRDMQVSRSRFCVVRR